MADVKRGKLSRLAWNALGTISLGLAVIGAVLPVMPTVPFLLLSAASYSRGSERMHAWMMSVPLFRQCMADYHEGKGTPTWMKLATIAVLWCGMLFSMHFLVHDDTVRIVLLIVAVAVSIHIMTIGWVVRRMRERRRR